MKYLIQKTAAPLDLAAPWDGAEWGKIEAMPIANVVPTSSDHHPKVEAKLTWSDAGLAGMFQVHDRYVLAVAEKFQDSVCRDSCVEFFLQPDGEGGYYNVEMNCGGTILTYFVRDWTSVDGGFKDYSILKDEEMKMIRIFHTMPKTVRPEIAEPTVWRIGFFLPFEFLRLYKKFETPVKGTCWRANLYKCADRSSHPHWITWNPIQGGSFHQPPYFGTLEFA